MDNKDSNDFYTFSEYMKRDSQILTASMEDYLEMIYRLSLDTGFTRIHELSNALNVQPPSATKMVQRLAKLKLLKYEKYGVIMLENEGKIMGETLLRRHKTIESLMKILGVKEEDILEETEKIEHTISSKTVECIITYLEFLNQNPDVSERFMKHKADKS